MKSYVKTPVDRNAYFEKLDLSRIPGKEEIDHKVLLRLTKGKAVMVDIAPGEALQSGDTVKLQVESSLPRFNKPTVTVTLGGGLYDKTLEAAVIGESVGGSGAVTTRDVEVKYTVLSAQRKTLPELTDEMAEEQGMEGVHTLAEFTKAYGDQLVDEAILDLMRDCCWKMEKEADVVVDPADEEAKLERVRDGIRKDVKEKYGLDADRDDYPEELQKTYHAKNLREHLDRYGAQFTGQIPIVLALCSAAGIEPVGDYDPIQNGWSWPNAFRVVLQQGQEYIRAKMAANG